MLSSTLWLALAAVALLLVLLGLDSDGLLLVGGSSTAVVGLLSRLGLPTWGQVLLFLSLGSLGYASLRRWGSRQRDRAAGVGTAPDRLAVATVAFAPGGPGRVRWQGNSWAALNLAEDQAIAPGEPLQVMGRDGNRLQVLPLEPQPAH